ncbi:MAG: carboxylating nicotinate-nucleotide diphosphorylase [Microthrixaceae bacterium]
MNSLPADSHWLNPPLFEVRQAVARALAEDLSPLGDLTSSLLPQRLGEARLVSRMPGRIAGTMCVTETLAQLDPEVVVSWAADEGDQIVAGQQLAVLRGPFHSILTAERTALNFLGHLSGIATLTAAFVAAAAEGGSAQVWDTRKTIPGLRSLAKAAVRAGGGRNHRGNLSDWLLIKDNHLGSIGITEAVRRSRDYWPARTVHVECDHIDQCIEALEAGADAILLDNMTPAEVVACVAAAEVRQGGQLRKSLLEVSGGITLESIASFSGTGVDMISVGAMTNSAPVLDLGLDLN